MIPTASLHLTMYFMPESPRWLAQRDEHEKALQSLARLHSNGDINDPFVHAELAEIEAKIQWERQNPPPSYIQMLVGRDRRRTWLAIGVVSLYFSRGMISSNFYLAILAASDWCQRVSVIPTLPLGKLKKAQLITIKLQNHVLRSVLI